MVPPRRLGGAAVLRGPAVRAPLRVPVRFRSTARTSCTASRDDALSETVDALLAAVAVGGEVDAHFDALMAAGAEGTPAILDAEALRGNYAVAFEAPSRAQGKSRPAGGKFTSGPGKWLFPSDEKRQDIEVDDDGTIRVRNWISFDLLGMVPGFVELNGRVTSLINLGAVPPPPPPEPVDPDDEPIMVRARKLAASWQQAKAEKDGKAAPPPATAAAENPDDWQQSDPGLEARAMKTLVDLGDDAPKTAGLPTLGPVEAATHALVAFSRPSIRLGFLPPFRLGPASRVLLSVPYIDSRVRLGLGGRGSRFVFRRVGADTDDVAGANPELDAERAVRGRARAFRRLSTIASLVACAAIFGGTKWLVTAASLAVGWGLVWTLWRGGQVGVQRKRRAEQRLVQ